MAVLEKQGNSLASKVGVHSLHSPMGKQSLQQSFYDVQLINQSETCQQ